MRKAAVFLFAVMGGKFACAQYKPLDKGSSIQFKIKNFGFNVTGTFSGLSGTIQFDPEAPATAAFDVSIDVNSVNTDNTMRDDHLRKFTYLDVKDYPHIRLLSTKIAAAGKKGNFLFAGKLTIRNHTRDISFPFTAEHSEGGYLFKGVFTINRKDFEVGGTSTISDNLEVSLGILAR